MPSIVRPCVATFLALSVLTGVVYPLAITGVAQVAFPGQANGSLIVHDDRVVGSRLLGQPFAGDGYFWSRPSATAPQPYNGAASSGSNLGPTNPALREAVRRRADTLHRSAYAAAQPIPVDLVTSSGSGLDPHLSPAAVAFQVARVARARQMTEAQVRRLVDAHTERRTLGVLGEPRVNVLELNLALDSQP